MPALPAPLAPHDLYPLLRHFLPAHPQSRRGADLRTRLDAVFWISATPLPWSRLPARFGRADTVRRWFHRVTAQGVWHHLLRSLHDAPRSDPLWRLAPMVLRACRRASLLLGPDFQRLIRRLGLVEALPGPPWLLRDPLLASVLLRLPLPVHAADPRTGGSQSRVYLRALIGLLGRVSGRRRLSRRLRLAWC